MDNQEKIAWLKRYTYLDREISRKVVELGTWRNRLLNPNMTARPKEVVVQGGQTADPTQIVDRLVDLEAEINAEITQLIEIKRDIERAVDTVEDHRLQLLLRYRYLDGMTWEHVAVAMDVTWQHIHKLHVLALKNLKMR